MKRNGGTKADTPVRSHEVSSLFSSESRSSNKKRGRKRRREDGRREGVGQRSRQILMVERLKSQKGGSRNESYLFPHSPHNASFPR